ncbi:dimethylhistidine N-methyltransferase [Breoghania corrubedonensis]|uniref:Dimethylhistidine N-methyltransferase n=1 Tax=Breoghania corrubedonensis TaxID=665038 RepID=A0A2T5V7U2_9HYPH|nr:L-histidine N(alpha)-methyltransferase [Breoghania corrubedonensis]PTW59823.1 dimethylhistidine N-methyltransferase [Breoghania corrubedonensis]
MTETSELVIEEGVLPSSDDFLRDALAGLTAPRKTLPTKYLYDAEGSRLFEEICGLPEYYPTRTETALLQTIAHDLAASISRHAVLVEFGSGASVKTRALLDAAPHLEVYVPIDISQSALDEAAESLRADFPDLQVVPLVADFTASHALPAAADGRPHVGFFPGSTIGNFSPEAAGHFLKSALATLGADSRFILGVDLAKEPEVMVPAYDDAQGVTAAFNLNLLARLNRELGADFVLDAFAHRAVWNEAESRMEMHLVSRKEQTVHLGGREIVFTEGETIHTENSHKYTYEAIAVLAAKAGWRIEESWVSDPFPFAILLMSAA